MSTLQDYLIQKRQAVRENDEYLLSDAYDPVRLSVSTTAEGRSGIRRHRVRDFQLITDSAPALAGYSLGPTEPELLLSAISGCLTHSFFVTAARQEVILDSLLVEVMGVADARGTLPGHEDTNRYPQQIAYVARVGSPASAEEVRALFDAVDATCPILCFFRKGHPVEGSLIHAGWEC